MRPVSYTWPARAHKSLAEAEAWTPEGRAVTLGEVALHSLHHTNQHQIMGVASHVSPVAPPFAAQFAEVTVDTETGKVRVIKLVTAMDSGVIINPTLASGQMKGAMAQALSYAVCEAMPYQADGQPLVRDLNDYHIFAAAEMPELVMRFVETVEPSHPFGVKVVGEIGIVGIARAVMNAIHRQHPSESK